MASTTSIGWNPGSIDGSGPRMISGLRSPSSLRITTPSTVCPTAIFLLPPLVAALQSSWSAAGPTAVRCSRPPIVPARQSPGRALHLHTRYVRCYTAPGASLAPKPARSCPPPHLAQSPGAGALSVCAVIRPGRSRFPAVPALMPAAASPPKIAGAGAFGGRHPLFPSWLRLLTSGGLIEGRGLTIKTAHGEDLSGSYIRSVGWKSPGRLARAGLRREERCELPPTGRSRPRCQGRCYPRTR